MIDLEQIRWVVYPKRVDDPLERDPVIALTWGWGACLTEEQLKTLPKDAPRGFSYVLVTVDMAEKLIGELQGIIKDCKENPREPTKECLALEEIIKKTSQKLSDNWENLRSKSV